MPAVAAIASAPQNATRAVALTTSAPPAFAPTAPNKARNPKDAALALSALAHQTRLRIFRLLVRAGPSGVPAGEISEHVGISPTSNSFHLKELDHAGLVTPARDRARSGTRRTAASTKVCINGGDQAYYERSLRHLKDAKPNGHHRCADHGNNLEVMPGKNLMEEDRQSKEAHACGDQN